MSLAHVAVYLDAERFPRVSGDEPETRARK